MVEMRIPQYLSGTVSPLEGQNQERVHQNKRWDGRYQGQGGGHKLQQFGHVMRLEEDLAWAIVALDRGQVRQGQNQDYLAAGDEDDVSSRMADMAMRGIDRILVQDGRAWKAV